MEFAKLLSAKKNPVTELKPHLITNNNEEYIEGAKMAFEQMIYSLETIEIQFSYEFNDEVHDRSIIMEMGGKLYWAEVWISGQKQEAGTKLMNMYRKNDFVLRSDIF